MDPELMPIPQPETKPTRPLILYVLLTAVVIFAAISSFLAYQNFQLQKQITRLTAQIKDVGLAPEPIPTEFQTANWKTYTNSKYKFEIKQPQDVLVGYFDVRSGLFNDAKGEEDQVDILLTSQTELFKKFIQIEITDAIAYEKTLTVAVKDIYSQQKEHFQTTNISQLNPIVLFGSNGYEYTFSGQAMIALNWGGVVEEGEYRVRIFEKDGYYFAFYSRLDQVLDQILSTFKFLDQSTDTPTSTSYTCPLNGYVDCMPNPNAGVRFECTPEAFTWYKANCPNFQGGAL